MQPDYKIKVKNASKIALSDLVVNENGELCDIPGISKAVQEGTFIFSMDKYVELPVNGLIGWAKRKPDSKWCEVEKAGPNDFDLDQDHISTGFL